MKKVAMVVCLIAAATSRSDGPRSDLRMEQVSGYVDVTFRLPFIMPQTQLTTNCHVDIYALIDGKPPTLLAQNCKVLAIGKLESWVKVQVDKRHAQSIQRLARGTVINLELH